MVAASRGARLVTDSRDGTVGVVSLVLAVFTANEILP